MQMKIVINTLMLMLVASFLGLQLKIEAQPFPRPLCVSQFALVNYACSLLPYTPLPPITPRLPQLSPVPSSPDDEDARHSHGDDGGDDDEHDHNHEHEHEHEHGNGHNHSHTHQHEEGHRHEHGHGHRHRHSHRHTYSNPRELTAQQNCCRWLNELDDECVCELLVRLPPFLSRPAHVYTLYLDESCNVTYACQGRIIRRP
ncbi:protein catecholamines up [Jatropha curcas]|uniref:protein catecholamines up n=1 Tax=Jatropha curcas TaxID=180498 RepID=UPI0005FABFC7|nr:protein catecholamines up [Jatropha curcas]